MKPLSEYNISKDATDKVYNNIYPDRDFTSGMEIPKSLRLVEERPKSQLKTQRHKKKRLSRVEDFAKKFKKLVRVKKQRADWEKMEASGEIVKKWYRYEPKPPLEEEEKKKRKQAKERLKTPEKKRKKIPSRDQKPKKKVSVKPKKEKAKPKSKKKAVVKQKKEKAKPKKKVSVKQKKGKEKPKPKKSSKKKAMKNKSKRGKK